MSADGDQCSDADVEVAVPEDTSHAPPPGGRNSRRKSSVLDVFLKRASTRSSEPDDKEKEEVKVKSILKTGTATRKRDVHVKWRTVLAGDEAQVMDQQAAQQALLQEREQREHYEKLAKLARLPMLTIEEIMIPMRLAFPDLIVFSPLIIFLDVMVDVFELGWIVKTVREQPKDPLAAYEAAKLEQANARDGQGKQPQLYLAAHAVRDIGTAMSLHLARGIYMITGDNTLWTLVQVVRVARVFDLVAYVESLNSDLTTNVKFLGSYKFGLVLVSVPHWVACVWWALATSLAPTDTLALPSWPAQFAHLSQNKSLRPWRLDEGQSYLMSLYMAWAGLTSMGYGTLVITTQQEAVFAAFVAALQMVFYAFVLGTLFHYLVRTDVATVHFNELMKAVDEFVKKRRLPKDLSARIRAHFVFQKKKQASGTDKIVAQMPPSMRTEAAVEQYMRQMTASWVFWSCNPQFLSAVTVHLRERHMMPSETLFKMGDGWSELMWCIGGTLFVTKGDSLLSTIRSDVGPGQVVGEVSFFIGVQQPYSVVASSKGEVTLIVLTTASYNEIMTSYPEESDTIVQNVLRKYGLDKLGGDLASGGMAEQMDEDELREYQELRERIRSAVIERNEDLFSQMSIAVNDGDVETVQALVARGSDPNSSSYDLRTPLHLAAIQGHRQVCKVLCELGAKWDTVDRFGHTPLMCAVDASQISVAQELALRGARLEFERPAERMHAAAKKGDMELVNMLVTNGVTIDAANYDGRTALHICAYEGNARMAQYLISSMSDVNIRDRWGTSPLDDAMSQDNRLVALMLSRHSARYTHELMARLLRTAASSGDNERVEFLLGMGVPVDTPDYDGRTALHCAVRAGSLSSTYSLLCALANAEVVDRWQRSPLHYALDEDTRIIALLLMQSGAKAPDPATLEDQSRGKLAAARATDMYALNRAIKEATRGYKAAQELVATRTRELDIELSRISDAVSLTVRTQRVLFRQLGRCADLWISEYGDDVDGEEEEQEDLDALLDGAAGADASEEESDAGGDAAADPGDADRAQQDRKHFLKVLLRLPQAEKGLSELSDTFQRRVVTAAPETASVARRRHAEHEALGRMLVEDLKVQPADAEPIVAEIYRELEVFLGAAAPKPPQGAPPAEEAAAEAEAEAHSGASDHGGSMLKKRRGSRPPEGVQSVLERHASTGNGLLALSKHLHRTDTAASVVAAPKSSASASAGSTSHDSGSRRPSLGSLWSPDEIDGNLDIFISDLGYGVLLCSKTLVAALSASYRADEAAPVPAGEDVSLSRRSRKRSEVSKATHVITSLFKVFDVSARGKIYMRDVRAVQRNLGEMKSEEIKSLVMFLMDTSLIFAHADARAQDALDAHRESGAADGEEAVGPGARPSGKRATRASLDMLRSGDFGSEIAALAEEPAGAGDAHLAHLAHLEPPAHPGGARRRHSSKPALRTSMGSVDLDGGHQRRQRCLTDVQFYVGVCAWVMNSADEGADKEAGADAADADAQAAAAGAGEGASRVPKLKSAAAHPPGKRSKESRADVAARAQARETAERDLAVSLAQPGAMHLLADNIQFRVDTGRLRADDHAHAEAFLELVGHSVVVPAAATPDMVQRWCKSRLDVDLLGANAAHEADDEHAPAAGAADEAKKLLALSAEEEEDSSFGVTWAKLQEAMRAVSAAAGEGRAAAAPALGGPFAQLLAALGLGASARVHPEAGDEDDEGGGSWPWYIVGVESAYTKYVHRVFLVLVAYDALFIPVVLGNLHTVAHMSWLPVVHGCVDAVYLARMAVRFHTTFVNDHGVQVTDPVKVRKRYLDTDFTLDLIACWPQDLMAYWLNAELVTVYGLRLLRFINTRYAVADFRAWRRQLVESDFVGGVMSNILPLLVLIHYCACVWSVMGYSELARSEFSVTWADEARDQRALVGGLARSHENELLNLFDNYLTSVFFVLSLVTALGIAQVPVNTAEFAGFTLMAVLNMSAYAWCVGGISGVVMKQDDEIVGKRAQLELVQGYVSHIHVPADLKHRMIKFFQQRLQHTSLSSVDSLTIYNSLPVPMQMEVAAHTNRALLGACDLLRGCSAGFLDSLSSALREREVEADTVVFRVGEACKELFVVASGELETTQETGDEEEGGGSQVHGSGSALGGLSFIFGLRHLTNCRVTNKKAFLFTLSVDGYKELMKTFPSQEDILMDNAMTQHEGLMTSRSGKSKSSAGGTSSGVPESSYAGSYAGSAAGDARSDVSKSARDNNARALEKVINIAKRKREDTHHARICTACVKGDFKKVREILSSHNMDIDRGDFEDRRALHLAAAGGNVKVLELLLACRADVHVEDKRGDTPLTVALMSGHQEAADLLAAHGASHGTKSMADRLCGASGAEAGYELLQRLCQHGNDVNASDHEQRTPLHIASSEGLVRNVVLLLQSKADANAHDRRGSTPLHDALRRREDEVCELLLRHGATLETFDGAGALNDAAAKDDTDHLARLIRFRCDVNAQDKLGRSPLHVAASCSKVNALNFLLNVPGVNPNLEDAFGNTPLDDCQADGPHKKVLNALLSRTGGVFGSHTRRELAERSADTEAQQLEKATRIAKQREEMIAHVAMLHKWIRQELEGSKVFKKVVDDALKLEREKGAVLADEFPGLWEKIYAFCEEYFEFRDEAAREVRPMLEAWAEANSDYSLSSMGRLQSKFNELMLLSETQAKPLDRLYEVSFRRPALGDAS